MAGGAIFKLGSFGNFRDLRMRKAGKQEGSALVSKMKRSPFATLTFFACPIKKEV